MYRLREVYRYPVKSTRGEALQEAVVEPRGLRGDRRWMIVDGAGRFVSQRSHPVLARVTATLDGPDLRLAIDGDGACVLRRAEAAEPVRVGIWDDEVDALHLPAADAWLSDLLGLPVRLVRMPETSRRPVDTRYAPDGHTVSFADGYPVLLIGTASLDDLNARLATPITMRRFRPNLVVATTQPFDEDGWRYVRIGTVELEIVKPCARCQVVTLDPWTGAGGKEPLRTLATYRKREGKVLFGQNAIVRRAGRVCVDDLVEVAPS